MKQPLYKATNVLLQTFLFTIYIIIYIVSKIINKMDKTTSQHTASTNDTRTKSPSYNKMRTFLCDSIRLGVATQKMPKVFFHIPLCYQLLLSLLVYYIPVLKVFYLDLCMRSPSLLCFDNHQRWLNMFLCNTFLNLLGNNS